MYGGFFDGGENPCGFYYIFGTTLCPGYFFRFHITIESNLFPIYNQFLVTTLNGSFELPMNGIVFQHIFGISYIEKRVIDTHNFYILIVLSRPKNQTTNPTKPVNTHFYCHNIVLL